MKMALVIIGLLLAGYIWSTRSGPSRGAGKYMPEPAPALSSTEVARDRPSAEAFNRAGWVTVDKDKAEAFGSTGKDVHCNRAWRQAVRSMPAGAQIRASRVLGRDGVCTWYVMRIVGPGGNVMSEFQRPGPRGSKPDDF